MLRVFVADDSPLVMERLHELIGDLDRAQVVGQAADVPTAVERIRQLQPDVVILDLRMPGGSGVQVLEAIKAQPPVPQAHARGGAAAPLVIVLTAFPYPQHRRRCLQAGADYFFDKTSEFNRVADVLQELPLCRDKNPITPCATTADPDDQRPGPGPNASG
jgi:CheY-like chemotaxis protein